MSLLPNQLKYHHNNNDDDDSYDNNSSFAIWCNDLGIEYMKHKEYHLAIRSFQNGLQSIKNIIMIRSTNHTTTTTNHSDHVVVRCSKKSRSSNTTMYHNSDDGKINDVHYEVFSSDTMMMMVTDTPPPSPINVPVERDSMLRPIRLLVVSPSSTNEENRNNDDDDDNNNATIVVMALERLTAILLHNLGLCYLRLLYCEDSGNSVPWLCYRAIHFFRLASKLWQGARSRLEAGIHVNVMMSFPSWYGIHQLELRTLTAMMQLQHHHQYHAPLSVKDDVSYRTYLIERIEQIERVLVQYRDAVHVLYGIVRNHHPTAPCA